MAGSRKMVGEMKNKAKLCIELGLRLGLAMITSYRWPEESTALETLRSIEMYIKPFEMKSIN